MSVFIVFALHLLQGSLDTNCLNALKETAEAAYVKGQPTIPRPAIQTLDAQTLMDLEIEKTVFPVIDRTMTALGRARLFWDLTHPMTDPVAIKRKQNAVKEIRDNPALRTKIEKALKKLKPVMDSFKDHPLQISDASHPGNLSFPILRSAIVIAITTLASTMFQSDIERFLALSAMPVVMFSFLHASPALTKPRYEMKQLRRPFKMAKSLAIELQKLSADDLKEMGNLLSLVETDSVLKEMHRRIKVLQYSIFTLPLDLVFGYSSALAWSVAHNINTHMAYFTSLMDIYADLDALLSRAKLSVEPGYDFPEILDQEDAELQIVKGHLPFELKNRGKGSVPNSIHLSARANPNFAIVAGPNKGGKSTFLRMALTLAAKGQSAFPVPAQLMRYTPMEIYSSMKTSDDQESGKSGYDKETDRALDLVNLSETAHRERRKLLIGFDEIYRGTNGDEKEAAVRGTILHLAGLGHIYFIAPHDERVVDLANETPQVANYHVEYDLRDGELVFSHEILPGPPTQRDGILLLEAKKFPKAITDAARAHLAKRNIAQDRPPSK